MIVYYLLFTFVVVYTFALSPVVSIYINPKVKYWESVWFGFFVGISACLVMLIWVGLVALCLLLLGEISPHSILSVVFKSSLM